MILKRLKYASYLILIFGFFYGTYHFGLMQGKFHERVNGENVVLISDCFESPLFTSCKHTYVNDETFIKVYEDLTEELKKHEPQEVIGEENLLCASQNPSPGSSQNINHPPSSLNGQGSELGSKLTIKAVGMK